MKFHLLIISIFMFLVTSVASAQSGSRTKKEMLSVAEQYDLVKKLMQQYPDGNFDHRIRYLGRDALLLESNKKLYVNGSPTEASNKRHLEIKIDSYNDECKRNASSSFCKAVTENVALYKTRYGSDYTPQDIVYPQINLDNYSYTLADGRTINLKTGGTTTSAVATSATTTVSTPVTVSAVTTVSRATAVSPTVIVSATITASQTTTASPTTSVSPTTTVSAAAAASGTAQSSDVSCIWQPGTNRRILTGEGCETQICSAMVICTKNGKKIKRLATCSSELCGEGEATACHSQLGYGSARTDFSKDTQTPAQSTPRRNSNQEGNTR